MKYYCRLLLLALTLQVYAHAQTSFPEQPVEFQANARAAVSNNDVMWKSPGTGIRQAMPTGNGDIGISMWLEKTGDILFYVSKSDSYDDNNRLLKIGRIRVAVTPNPFLPGDAYTQRLDLQHSEITIRSVKPRSAFFMRLWVDANHPVIRMEMKGEATFRTRVVLENWRRKPYEITDVAFSDAYGADMDGNKPQGPMVQYPDSILKTSGKAVVWYHQNKRSCWPATLKLQGLSSLIEKQTDPLQNNIFGAAIAGSGLINQSDTSLVSSRPVSIQDLSVVVKMNSSSDPEQWFDDLSTLRTRIGKLDTRQCRQAHRQWWQQFWARSYINIHSNNDTGALISRSYTLQRYLSACSGRGAGWIKFNGSLFTLPEGHDGDYRKWGSAQWFQNARLVYWPMIASGDFDLLSPYFGTFLSALALARQRTKLYYGHDGAFFSETAYRWGTYSNADYGYNRSGLEDGFVTNPYVRRHWSGGLELTAMMLMQYDYTQSTKFLTDTLLPIAAEVITFYDQHWKRGADGRIYFSPAQALETWQTAVNPLPEIAGLRELLPRLLALPEKLTTMEQRTQWSRMLRELPGIPDKTVGGKTRLLPADSVTQSSNVENPELYAVFPFRLFGVGKPFVDVARNTYDVRINRESRCWYQDDIQAAYLGLTGEAVEGVTKRMTGWNHDYRFPAMWGPGNDELPDMDHGGAGQMALQAMLMQTMEDTILLLPAWPATWDVSFRLLAPRNTVVEGEVRRGKLQSLVVQPAARRKDIIVMGLR